MSDETPTVPCLDPVVRPACLGGFPGDRGAELRGSTLHVTLSHPDTGWEHYTDGWEVRTPDGVELGLRVLAHPHVQEQPFTRSLSVDVPDGVEALHIRARCNRDGWGDQVFVLPLD